MKIKLILKTCYKQKKTYKDIKIYCNNNQVIKDNLFRLKIQIQVNQH